MVGTHHKNGRRKDPQKKSQWEIPQHKIIRKTKKKMERLSPERCVTGPRNTMIEKMRWEQRRNEASFELGQGRRRCCSAIHGLTELITCMPTDKR